jgi:hypothetical protein
LPCSILARESRNDFPERPLTVPDRVYTDPELDAAIAAISAPDRLREAEELVTRSAPSLQRVLNAALADGGWFDQAHEQAVREAAGGEDPELRVRALRTLIAEETRLGMLVGVAVGFELARELEAPTTHKE